MMKYEPITEIDIHEGTIEFKGVSFCYPDAGDRALKDISFSVGEGETLAIIGATGSGKTTLINLIPRFYDCTEGEILVDGIDIRQYKQSALHVGDLGIYLFDSPHQRFRLFSPFLRSDQNCVVAQSVLWSGCHLHHAYASGY